MKIVLSNYTKILSRTSVLDDICLELESGKIYGFVGKNGCGKTMLMRAICGLIVPTSGEIIIDGKRLGQDISFPPSVGALIENPGFISGYTGYKNLKYLSQIQGQISDKEICDVLESVGLDPKDKRTYRKYSLGMRQKLGIAGAIIGKPQLIILDEPFNGLDEETHQRIHELILDLKTSERIIILSCHDREEIEKLSDSIAEIKQGKIVCITHKAESNNEDKNQ